MKETKESKMSYGDYPELKDIKKILVIKMRHLGDVLLTTALFSELKEKLENASIDAYVYEESRQILSGNPSIDMIHGYDRKDKKLVFWKKLFKEIRFIWKMRKQNYDMVINLTEGDRGAIIAKFSGAKIKVGFDPEGSGMKGKKKIYTHVVKKCKTLRHTVERDLDVLRRIGIFPEKKQLFLSIPENAYSKVTTLLDKIDIKDYILIHPASRWRFKCLPTIKMRQLIQALLSRGEKIILTASSDPIEKQMVQDIAKGFDQVFDLSGQFNLKELGALIDKSKAVICVDSVTLHICSALKVKCVGIFGPTSDVTWGPWQNDHAQVVYKNISCRPCYLDGCGGSKYSDCLHTLEINKIVRALDVVLKKPIVLSEMVLT